MKKNALSKLRTALADKTSKVKFQVPYGPNISIWEFATDWWISATVALEEIAWPMRSYQTCLICFLGSLLTEKICLANVNSTQKAVPAKVILRAIFKNHCDCIEIGNGMYINFGGGTA